MAPENIKVSRICPVFAQTWFKNDAILVDVREEAEIEQVSFVAPHVITLSYSHLEELYPILPLDKLLVICCNNGIRSLKAASFIIGKGYSAARVVCLKRGMINWIQKGFPTRGEKLEFAQKLSIHSGCCNA